MNKEKHINIFCDVTYIITGKQIEWMKAEMNKCGKYAARNKTYAKKRLHGKEEEEDHKREEKVMQNYAEQLVKSDINRNTHKTKQNRRHKPSVLLPPPPPSPSSL